MSGEPKTVKEMEEELRKFGINPGSWGNAPGGKYRSPYLDKFADGLTKIRDLLQKQVDQDKRLLAELAEKKARLEHGGGR